MHAVLIKPEYLAQTSVVCNSSSGESIMLPKLRTVVVQVGKDEGLRAVGRKVDWDVDRPDRTS